MFVYTLEEQEHLIVLIETAAVAQMEFRRMLRNGEFTTDVSYDIGYFRHLASMEREDPSWQYPSHEGPHADDMDYTSAEDYDEMADALECGYQRGEECY